ncbi:XRE family transcriptional regulator [Brevundimonas sp.]|uniref:XRE family transcriptional regulator n=1 Tax=Brevundimonas sp. TaxID=1871086 RepID=UPI000E900A16|nr:XRE family transcriptional regulator [Brevundimonas sp.]HBY42163.1 peptidase [Brevundimonas sp.]
MPRINPQILTWARETAGLSVAEAARKMGFKDSGKGTAEERLLALEAGEAEPSRPQLVKAASAFRRPLLAFYMPAPPAAAPSIEDYRTLPEVGEGRAEANLKTLVRDISVRQALVRDLLEDEELEPRRFPGSLRLADGVASTRLKVERELGWNAARFRGAANSDKAFDYLRRLIEDAGIYVVLISDLGNHVTTIDVETFRGFALTDSLAPFIVINDQDAKSAWSFTLLHELIHIGLGASGVSGKLMEGAVERFCNDVASAILLPPADLNSLAIEPDAFDENRAAIRNFAQRMRVSGAMVTYRLYLDGRITEADWRLLSNSFLADWRQYKAAQKEKRGAPDFYTVRRQRLGQALLAVVRRNVEGGTLSPVKAAKVLGVSPRGVDPLLTVRAA